MYTITAESDVLCHIRKDVRMDFESKPRNIPHAVPSHGPPDGVILIKMTRRRDVLSKTGTDGTFIVLSLRTGLCTWAEFTGIVHVLCTF